MKTVFLFLALVCSQLLAACATTTDPDKLLATEPTAAGPQPWTREQVLAELERARQAGEMDFAESEASLDAPRHR
ncbi:MAG TPA: DUF4148 domain-containing protein [Roseateles sp.]